MWGEIGKLNDFFPTALSVNFLISNTGWMH
jgi:hypothetical protein